MTDFVHLHCHTEYSLLDGAIRLKDLCKKSLEYGFPACAITDHGNMYGAAYFYAACKEFGVKPIIGCEVYICKNHKDKSPETGKFRNHLILLAQNNAGYHNLVKLVSRSFIDGYYYKPRIDKELLRSYSEGLICLSACLAGEVPAAILAGDMDRARQTVDEYAAIFPGRYYLELQSNGIKKQEKVNNALLELAKSRNLPLVATNDCHYLNRDDAYAHEVLLCIQTQTTMNNADRMRFETDEFYYKSGEEMQEAFSHVPEAIANTVKIAEQCNVELDFGHHYFPVYPLPEDASIESELCRLAREGLEKRLEKHPNRKNLDVQTYRDRLEHELKVIIEMGFPGYFLIVQEFINWAKDNGIPVGPGRGSAAGSLVAWALRITNIDPLPYNLLFERFLNIERVSLPDIDVDFCERRRHEVIRHMVDRYGSDSVAQIITFGTMKAKGVVRDVGRALGMTYAAADRVARLVPDRLKMTIEKALEEEPELVKMRDTDEEVKHLLDVAKRLEGLARHASTHAAGLVVSDRPMSEYLPLTLGKNGELVTQFDGPMTEKTGLVKFDFLGLKTMTLIQDTLNNIAQQGLPVPDLDNLPLDDAATYELYSCGDTDGIFQVESSGMRQYLRMLKPNCFEDIIAMLALYRPGPLEANMVDDFIKRKHGKAEVVYPHESLKECLKDTYGVIVYQEQVMQIAQIIANYTLGGADLLRRAMGKKKAEAMAKERTNFVSGAEKNGISAKKANEIFDLMEKFASYGFNKSHSAAYALISYYTAWLRVHYPVEFMAALLTSEMGNQEKLLKYISACKYMGIEVVQPSINDSQFEFAAKDGKVIYGLCGIKNVGAEATRAAIEDRQENGLYKSLYDFCCRVNKRKVSRRMLESLIKSGACDCFGITRAAMIACLDIVMQKAQKTSKSMASAQASLLGTLMPKKEEQPPNGLGIDIQEAHLPEMTDELKLKNEKDALGFYLSSHPLQSYSREIVRLGLSTLESCDDKYCGETINCAVLVTSLKEVVTKTRGERMAFVGVEDLTGHAEVTFFPKNYMAVRELLQSDQPLCLSAKLEEKRTVDRDDDDESENGEGQTKLMGIGIRLLKDVCNENSMPVLIHIPSCKLNEEALQALKQILLANSGDVQVEALVDIPDCRVHLKLDPKMNVSPGSKLDSELNSWLASA